ncbi:MAG: dTDP-4-dehydrorhamnose reductase [Alphaproteobacteria bacterium]|nr:dTDP-4-dehydrorhamnose reductase [Alphaproteobacteria bacterium]
MTGPILLFGGNGQVGWELRRTLAPLGDVRALERADVDLVDHDALRRLVREAAPSLIVNAAAYTAVDRAEEDAALAHAVNAEAPRILAEEAKRLNGGLVHFSTDYVFDGSASRPYRETDAPSPVNVYGKSKQAGEAAIEDTGCAHLILRTSWVYSMRGANFLLTVRRLAAELEELRIVGDQRGAPTWARAIAEATALLLARCSAPSGIGDLREQGGLYHLTASGEASWHGFAVAVVDWMRATGQPVRCKRILDIPTRDYPTPAKRPANSLLDGSKLREAFGIAIPDWREQLTLCLEA